MDGETLVLDLGDQLISSVILTRQQKPCLQFADTNLRATLYYFVLIYDLSQPRNPSET